MEQPTSLGTFLDTYYQNVLHSIANPIVITNLDKNIVFLNRAAESLFGRPLAECFGKSCSSFQSPLCGTEDCCIKRFLRGGEPAIQHNAGKSYRVSMSSLLDAAGRPVGYISVSTDVTELFETQQALSLSEERYRIALEQTHNAIWEYDIAQKTVSQTNLHAKNAAEQFGLPLVLENMPESLLASGIVLPDSLEAARALYRKVDEGAAFAQAELHLRTPEGRDFWLEIMYTTVFGADGAPLRAIGVSRDRTTEKLLESQYRQERQYRDSLVAGAMYVYEVNLSQDRLLHIAPDWTSGAQAAPPDSYTALLLTAQQTMVHPGYHAHLTEAFSRDALLDAFAAGKQEVHCVYQRLDDQNAMIWAKASAYLIRAQASGDVCAFIYIKNIDQEKRKELELRRKAEQDPLTKLFNRTTVLSLVGRSLAAAEDSLCALFMLDLDNFKQINDTYGHLFGDAVLSEHAKKLTALFRRGDLIGRLGGDEFVVFLSHLPNRETAVKKARDLCSALQMDYTAGDRVCPVSVSLGIAFSPEHGNTFEDLYEKADTALYYAKSQGKNRFAVYDEAMSKPDAACPKPQPTVQERHLAKSFSENIIEYVFKILYHSDDLDLSIRSVLALLGRHLDISHSYICEYVPKEDVYRIYYAWDAAGAVAARSSYPEFTSAQMRPYQELFSEDGLFLVPDAEKVPELFQASSAQISGLFPASRSYMQCAMTTGNTFHGFIGVGESKRRRVFTAEEREILKSIAEIIGTFLRNKRHDQERTAAIATLQTVLDNLESVVYVVDPKDYGLVFSNKRTRLNFPTAAPGDRCHQTFRNLSAPCPDCPLPALLSQNRQKSHAEMYNAILGRWVSATANTIQWPDGGAYCILNCIDITRFKKGTD